MKLGDVIKIDRMSIQSDQIRSGTMYVGLENITSEGVFNGVRTVENGDLASSKFAFSENHVLFGKLRPYLRKVIRPTFSGVCSTDILPLQVGNAVDKNYLYHWLLLPEVVDLATSRSSGANLPRLSPSTLLEFEIPLPPLAEQKRIAALLDEADALRRKRRESLAKLDSLLQSVFLDMFGDPVINSKGWEIVTLVEFIEIGPQNGLYKPGSFYGEGTPILRIDAFYDGEITDLSKLKRVKLNDSEKLLYGLNENDLVINRVNSLSHLGKSAIVQGLIEPTVFESNMMRFSVFRNRVDPHFLIHLLQSKHIKNQILSRAKNAVNQSSINQQDVKDFKIMLPPFRLQEEFASRVTAINTMREQHQVSLNRLETLFTTLQHHAFAAQPTGSAVEPPPPLTPCLTFDF